MTGEVTAWVQELPTTEDWLAIECFHGYRAMVEQGCTRVRLPDGRDIPAASRDGADRFAHALCSR